MLILRALFHWFRKAGTCIDSPNGNLYSFFHFPTPIEMEIDGKRIKTKPNACIFSEPFKHRGFYFTQDTTVNWIHAYIDIKPFLEKYGMPINTVFYPQDTGFISDIFRKMKLELLQQKEHNNDMLDAYAIEFLVLLSRSIHGDSIPELDSVDFSKLYRMRTQVLSQADQKWTVEQMAQMVSLSPSRFHSVYKTIFGSSPMQDVIDAKMDLAKTILLTEDKPTLAEIAERLGYKSTQHFIMQFKNATGMTPGVYRRNNQ